MSVAEEFDTSERPSRIARRARYRERAAKEATSSIPSTIRRFVSDEQQAKAVAQAFRIILVSDDPKAGITNAARVLGRHGFSQNQVRILIDKMKQSKARVSKARKAPGGFWIRRHG